MPSSDKPTHGGGSLVLALGEATTAGVTQTTSIKCLFTPLWEMRHRKQLNNGDSASSAAETQSHLAFYKLLQLYLAPSGWLYTIVFTRAEKFRITVY